MPSKRWYLEKSNQGCVYVIVDGLEMVTNGKAVGCLRTITEASTEPRASTYKDQALMVCCYKDVSMNMICLANAHETMQTFYLLAYSRSL